MSYYTALFLRRSFQSQGNDVKSISFNRLETHAVLEQHV